MKTYLVHVLLLLFCHSAIADLTPVMHDFKALYVDRLGTVSECGTQYSYNICSSKLRNEGNGPFILHHGKRTDKVTVLFHGLSDSPFYLRPVAEYLHGLGINVVVALLPGHGLKNAHDVILDSALSDMWSQHVEAVMGLASGFGDNVLIGGFSTGGALSVQYTLSNQENIKGLMLFSGALALSGNAESLAKIWGIQWLANMIEGDYVSVGPNPYKYPSVPSSAGLELMEIIWDIRRLLEEGSTLNIPVFVVHSEADKTTPIEGVKNLLKKTNQQNTVFYISQEYNVCHADVVLNMFYVSKINFDSSSVNPLESCAVPKANQMFRQMINLLGIFIDGVE